MARSRRRRVRRVRPPAKQNGLRGKVLRVVAIWNRFQVGGVIVGVVLIWLTGAAVLHLVERETNKAFGTIGESLWSVWILIFSGEVEPPTSIIGRIASMVCSVSWDDAVLPGTAHGAP